MKHLQAGFTVGGIALAALVTLALIWSLFSVVVGSVLATVGLIVVIVVTVAAVVIDWKTEKR